MSSINNNTTVLGIAGALNHDASVSIIKGSDIVVGNQSLFFALAEAIKHPRVLEVYYKKNNCQPQSNNGYTYLSRDIIRKHIS